MSPSPGHLDSGLELPVAFLLREVFVVELTRAGVVICASLPHGLSPVAERWGALDDVIGGSLCV